MREAWKWRNGVLGAWLWNSEENLDEQLACQALLQDDSHVVAYAFANGFAQVGFYRQFVGAVAQSHEGTAKGMTIDLAANFYQAAGPEKLYRGGPDNVNPATFLPAFSQLGGEFFV